MEEYDDLDWLYEVLYASFHPLFLENAFIEQFKGILDLSHRIHDASCGNGIQALALARRGYRVSASDLSPRMVELTRERAQGNGFQFPLFTSSWERLPERNEKYDLVFCYGNSICHSMGSEERKSNLRALSACLDEGGRLVVDTRNWDKVRKQKYAIYEARGYRGKKYLPIYVWDISMDDGPSSVDMIFVESADGTMRTLEKKLSFCAFRHSNFVREIESLGLRIVQDSFYPEADEYAMVLSRE